MQIPLSVQVVQRLMATIPEPRWDPRWRKPVEERSTYSQHPVDEWAPENQRNAFCRTFAAMDPLVSLTHSALAHILAADRTTRTDAEAFIASKLGKPNIAGPVYAQIVANSHHDSVRQLAGVLLRRQINGWFGHVKTSQETRSALPKQLISLLVAEASRPPAASCAAGERPYSRQVCKALVRLDSVL